MKASVTLMNPKRGLFYAMLSAICYAVMSYLVHWNPQKYPATQLVFIRGVSSILFLLPLCYQDLNRYFRKDAQMLWVRALTGSVGVICYFWSLQGTVSANANFLFSLSPIFVSVLSWLLLREKVTRLEALGIAVIVFASVLLYIPNRQVMPFWVWATGLTGAFFASFAYLSLGQATKKYSASLIIIGFAFSSTVFSYITPSAPWIPLQYTDFTFLFFTSLLGLLSQITATYSFAHLKSPIATALGRTSILFSGVLDIFITGYRPHPLELSSYFIIMVGIYLALGYRKSTKRLA